MTVRTTNFAIKNSITDKETRKQMHHKYISHSAIKFYKRDLDHEMNSSKTFYAV